MSNRTLVELNHDYCPISDTDCLAWAKLLVMYMRSGNKDVLPTGVTFKHFRHHSEPEPMTPAPVTTQGTEGAKQRVKRHYATIGNYEQLLVGSEVVELCGYAACRKPYRDPIHIQPEEMAHEAGTPPHMPIMTMREIMEAKIPSTTQNGAGWVKVEDGLPKDTIARLVYVQETECHFTASWHGEWRSFQPGSNKVIHGVTHYKEIQNDKPLPAPPVTDGKDA